MGFDDVKTGDDVTNGYDVKIGVAVLICVVSSFGVITCSTCSKVASTISTGFDDVINSLNDVVTRSDVMIGLLSSAGKDSTSTV